MVYHLSSDDCQLIGTAVSLISCCLSIITMSIGTVCVHKDSCNVDKINSRKLSIYNNTMREFHTFSKMSDHFHPIRVCRRSLSKAPFLVICSGKFW